jgi:hypothetical protein
MPAVHHLGVKGSALKMLVRRVTVSKEKCLCAVSEIFITVQCIEAEESKVEVCVIYGWIMSYTDIRQG